MFRNYDGNKAQRSFTAGVCVTGISFEYTNKDRIKMHNELQRRNNFRGARSDSVFVRRCASAGWKFF